MRVVFSLWKGRMSAPTPLPATIIAQAAADHGVSVADLKGPGRRRQLAHARWDAMWRLRQEWTFDGARPRWSSAQIARMVGLADHTSVLYGVARWSEIMAAFGVLPMAPEDSDGRQEDDVPWTSTAWAAGDATELIRRVAAEYGVSLVNLYSERRERRVVRARWEAMWRLRHWAEHGGRRYTLTAIADLMDRDHTTVMYGIRRHQAILDRREALAA